MNDELKNLSHNKENEEEFREIAKRCDYYDELLHDDKITVDEHSALFQAMRDTAEAHCAEIIEVGRKDDMEAQGYRREYLDSMIDNGGQYCVGVLQ